MEERLQKIMARAGLGSRRECEKLILAGRVHVNGVVAEIGQKADVEKDKITLDGQLIEPPRQLVYIALYKPRFVLSTVEAEAGDARPTVRDLVPIEERVYPVGRLDFESEGLILLTNDGALTQQLTHPSHGHVKVYRVLLARHPDSEQLAIWRRGVVLEDGYRTRPADVQIETLAGKGAWVRVAMQEGRKRQIREIAAALGLPVVRLIRVAIGPLKLGALKPKEWRYLTPAEVAALKGEAAEVRAPSRGGKPKRSSKEAVRPRRGSPHRVRS